MTFGRVLLLVALLNTSAVIHAAPVLDQQQPVINNSAGFVIAIGGGAQQKLAQVVTAGISGLLTEVRLPVSCSNPGPGLIVEIQGVTAGLPNGTVLTTQTVPTSSVPPFPALPTFRALVLSAPVYLAAGSRFAVVLMSTGDCAVAPGPVGDSYIPGNLYFDARPNPPGWVCVCNFAGASYDLPFQTLVEVPTAPTIAKAFGSASIALNGTTSLSFTINNANVSTPLTGVGFTDTLPAGLLVATPNGLIGSCGGGMIVATAASGGISLTGATLAASAGCTFSVGVTGTTAGTKNNTTGAVTSVEGGPGGTASASVSVAAATPPPSDIPTLRQWALWLLGLFILVATAAVISRQRKDG